MNSKNAEVDSGKFENGIYTTKNGYSGLGLACPKGTRLYDVIIKTWNLSFTRRCWG